MPRTKPNIIITGTPGVGKTTLCESLTGTTDLKHLAINRVAKERGCHAGWDDALNSWVVDEDKVRCPAHSGNDMDLLVLMPDRSWMPSKTKSSKVAT